jgi:flagellar biosynthesis protein FlhG
MRSLPELDYFEVLEVSRDASSAEIERAYRLAKDTYADDSLAGYSVFDDGDAAALRQRIEAAYRVLSNAASREAYRASLVDGTPAAEDATEAPQPETQASEALTSADELVELEDDSPDFDGPRLRRARMRLGMEIEEIAKVTKVNAEYLRCLEQERFTELPAPVYVRGFVAAFASCVRLDPTRVTASYMKRVESSRRNRLFAR